MKKKFPKKFPFVQLKPANALAVDRYVSHKSSRSEDVMVPDALGDMFFSMVRGRALLIGNADPNYLRDAFTPRTGLTVCEAKAYFWEEVAEKRDLFNAMRAYLNDPAVERAFESQCFEPDFEAYKRQARERLASDTSEPPKDTGSISCSASAPTPAQAKENASRMNAAESVAEKRAEYLFQKLTDTLGEIAILHGESLGTRAEDSSDEALTRVLTLESISKNFDEEVPDLSEKLGESAPEISAALASLLFGGDFNGRHSGQSVESVVEHSFRIAQVFARSELQRPKGVTAPVLFLMEAVAVASVRYLCATGQPFPGSGSEAKS